jgi:hypothetical protein
MYTFRTRASCIAVSGGLPDPLITEAAIVDPISDDRRRKSEVRGRLLGGSGGHGLHGNDENLGGCSTLIQE